MSRGRAYLRVLPESFGRKAFGVRDKAGALLRDPYPTAAVAAFFGILCLADYQPERGRFGSLGVVKALLEGPNGEGRAYARQVPYLVAHKDLVVLPGGVVYVDGWDELQEGDLDVPTRMRRYRDRKAVTAPSPDPAAVTPDNVTSVTPPTVTLPRGQRNHPLSAIESTPVVLLSGEQTSGERRAENGSPSRDPVRPPTWFDSETPEGPALTWLATHGAALAPGSRLELKLVRLVQVHGAACVLSTFEAIALEGSMTEARQFVFGADNLLNRIPAAPKAPDSEEQASRSRSDRERASLRAEQERQAAMLAAAEAPP